MPTFEEIAIVLAGLHIKSDDPALQQRLNVLLHLLIMIVWLNTLVTGVKTMLKRDYRIWVLASIFINLAGVVTALYAFIVVKEDVTLEISELVVACAVRYIHQILVTLAPAPATLPITAAIAMRSDSSTSSKMRDSITEAIGSALRLACPEAAVNVSHVPFLKFGSHVYGTTIYTLDSHQNTAATSETTSAASAASPSTGFIYKIISVVAGRE